MEVMSGLVTRWCRAHGELCAQRPWEVMFLLSTATVVIMTQPHAHEHQSCHAATKASAGGGGGAEYEGVHVWVMTALRCGAMLYTYHQFRLLHRQGSSHVLGIAVLFVLFAMVLFSCCVVQLLGCSVSDLEEAVFFLLLVMDVSKMSRLSLLALQSRGAREAILSIGEGLALLGPGLSLDTCVEALLVGAGSLSGIGRLEQICQFAVLSILVNYGLLMTFFPACLSLVLQMSSRREICDDHNSDSGQPKSESLKVASTDITDTLVPDALPRASSGIHPSASQDGSRASQGLPSSAPQERSSALPVAGASSKPVWQVGYCMHCAAALVADEACTHNPVLQRVKVIMSAGLVLVHGISRFSVVLPSSEPALLHTHNLSDTSHTQHPAVRLLAEGLEQCVVVVLVVVLLIKYAMFEGRGELEQQILKQRHLQQSCDRCSAPPTGDSAEEKVNGADRAAQNSSAAEDVQEASACYRDCSSQTETGDLQDVWKILEVPVCSSQDSDLNKANETAANASMTEKLAGKPKRNTIRSFEECVAILNDPKFGAKELTDDEVVEMVQKKQLPGYKLETALQDDLRGVKVRRQVVAPLAANVGAFDSLPYLNYDYSKVMGVCCESVVGYIPVPVGIAGPLTVNEQSLLIPLATTEGCLVASTNRGCRALQMSEEGGVKSHVLQNGMTRAPVVMLPSLSRAAELYHWLQKKEHQARLKEAFDRTSSYARMEDISTTLNGRKLHLRFLASTGDAMGMNMVSKGVEAALKLLRELFPDVEVLSISGNLCTDKKPSAVNWVRGRGKYVVSGAVVPGSVVRSVLKTSVEALVQTHVAKNLEGSALAGSIGGNNAHAANIVAAIFIACGQDAAQVVGSSNCITQLEACGPNGEDLFASVTMPSLEVGTVGGGTALPAQAACLHMLGVKGSHPDMPGNNAEQLARIVCSAVLAGELSLMAALTAGHVVKSHMKHNRAKTIETRASLPPSSVEVEETAARLPVDTTVVHPNSIELAETVSSSTKDSFVNTELTKSAVEALDSNYRISTEIASEVSEISIESKSTSVGRPNVTSSLDLNNAAASPEKFDEINVEVVHIDPEQQVLCCDVKNDGRNVGVFNTKK
ncbi:3-hydroxy-3-methylglutaryl-coenzyme A reductase-like isoform X2 [Hyalella azteca]|uniref:3-hydroxy-3-methylglutaryl coenzyme A reductase n=3 Tax=Hyalella azteca TaxID=294128 RepID=A0A979FJF9_HYAAZ|nr:3-hydroxy-3-methylglutaryl-coenzyme A reductase-like isoform X1 [Hyalella azteca]XP_047736867.1 3-hydroxy-3-methylglutaryl-coenzyme A reductase-like isoform X2 [Hyalella azteca]